jgi:hypothetical protein
MPTGLAATVAAVYSTAVRHRVLALVLSLALGLVVLVLYPFARRTQAAPSDPLPVSIPPLPFADNPDPLLCGIPEPDDRMATVIGDYRGALVQPIVYLYDSHLRTKITGQIYPGTRVHVKLSQYNPTLNYYFVRTVNVEPAQEGWIPEPFLRIGKP